MDPMSALALLSSPTGAKGGGGSIPNLNQQEAKSGASLDASGSTFNLSSGNGASDFIVGGTKNNTWVLLLAVGAVAFFLLRK